MHRGQPIRVLYAFDPNREALLLVAGVQADGKRWYRSALRTAESIWERHLEQLEERDG